MTLELHATPEEVMRAVEALQQFAQAIDQSGLEHFIRRQDVKWDAAKNAFRGFEIVR